MTKENQLTLMVECEECKQKFAIGTEQAPNSITNKKKYEVDGKSIFLTYYDCPSCGRRHFVQIDDQSSLAVLRETKMQFVKLATKRKQGKEITKKQSDRFSKTRKHLSSYRLGLMQKYTGKSIYDEATDSYFVLRFSV